MKNNYKDIISNLELQKDLAEARSIEVCKWMWPGGAFTPDDARVLYHELLITNNLKAIKEREMLQ